MTKADQVEALLSKTYFCILCKREERRLRSIPNLRKCLHCASPAEIVEYSASLMGFYGNSEEVSYLVKEVGIARYSQIIDEFTVRAKAERAGYQIDPEFGWPEYTKAKNPFGVD